MLSKEITLKKAQISILALKFDVESVESKIKTDLLEIEELTNTKPLT